MKRNIQGKITEITIIVPFRRKEIKLFKDGRNGRGRYIVKIYTTIYKGISLTST